MKKRTQKRGFTVAEIVIAMAVVVLVTATALTTVLTTRNAEERILREADAVRLAENAWECFKVTETPEDFALALSFAEEGKDAPVLVENGVCTVSSTRYGYEATLTVSGNTLNVLIVADEKELVSFTYTKGGEAP